MGYHECVSCRIISCIMGVYQTIRISILLVWREFCHCAIVRKMTSPALIGVHHGDPLAKSHHRTFIIVPSWSDHREAPCACMFVRLTHTRSLTIGHYDSSLQAGTML